jgi:hypothetical protein
VEFASSDANQRASEDTRSAHFDLLILVYLKTEVFGEEVMQPFMVSYTKAINKQQGRVGPIFQGPYQAKWVNNERYLLHLTRYIHLNPVTAGFVDRPEDWAYSSYQDYVGLRPGTLPQPEPVLAQLDDDVRNPVFDKNRVSERYASYVCGESDARAGLVASLLFD